MSSNKIETFTTHITRVESTSSAKPLKVDWVPKISISTAIVKTFSISLAFVDCVCWVLAIDSTHVGINEMLARWSKLEVQCTNKAQKSIRKSPNNRFFVFFSPRDFSLHNKSGQLQVFSFKLFSRRLRFLMLSPRNIGSSLDTANCIRTRYDASLLNWMILVKKSFWNHPRRKFFVRIWRKPLENVKNRFSSLWRVPVRRKHVGDLNVLRCDNVFRSSVVVEMF